MENQLVIEGVRVDGVLTLVLLVGWILIPLRYLGTIGYGFVVVGGGVALLSLYTIFVESAAMRGGMMLFAAMSYLVSAALPQERFWRNFTGEEGYPTRIKGGTLMLLCMGTAVGFLI